METLADTWKLLILPGLCWRLLGQTWGALRGGWQSSWDVMPAGTSRLSKPEIGLACNLKGWSSPGVCAGIGIIEAATS